mgnify:CR=1 FL=1
MDLDQIEISEIETIETEIEPLPLNRRRKKTLEKQSRVPGVRNHAGDSLFGDPSHFSQIPRISSLMRLGLKLTERNWLFAAASKSGEKGISVTPPHSEQTRCS